MKTLVTGGAGFIGSNIVKLLLSKGYRVIIVDNLSSGSKSNIEGLDVDFYQYDIRNRDKMVEISKDVDVVYHLAASVGRQKSLDNPIDDSDINLLGTLSILEAMRKNKIKKIIYSSSAAIYGELLTEVIDENHPLNADSPYGVSKLAAEKMILAYGKIYNIETVCLRYFNIFGLGQRYDLYGNVIPIFVRKALRDEEIIIFGDGYQTRDFVNVKDVAYINYLSALLPVNDLVVNVGTGQSITINYLAKLIIEIVGSKSKIVYAPERLADVKHCKANTQRLEMKLKYVPSLDFTVELIEYVNWYRKSENILSGSI